MEVLKNLGRFFYVISPNETAIKSLDDLPHPDYINQAVPYFIAFIIIEAIVLKVKNKPGPRINDGIVSLSHGMYLGLGQFLVRGIESYGYVKIYENWRIYELPWDSAWTWYLAAILVDFGYYWLHRAAHEINVFWAQHQVHHSSEDYNLTTALRQSALQGWIGWLFYLPMAFFVPPQIFLIHQQFNLLFQFWIHTEIVDSLGPLEYILNTPNHHRIHHGSNRYCLDKNYAGWLIIWDRMFGTFEKVKPGEKIFYGLVEEVNSFEPFYLQFFYMKKIHDKAKTMNNWKDKVFAWLKGPGWFPGTPRLGDINMVPEVPTRKKFHVKIPTWKNIYVLLHFALVIVGFDQLQKLHIHLSQLNVTLVVLYTMFCLTSIGLSLEDKKIGIIFEIIRCGSVLIANRNLNMGSYLVGEIINWVFSISLLILSIELGHRLFFAPKTAIKKAKVNGTTKTTSSPPSSPAAGKTQKKKKYY